MKKMLLFSLVVVLTAGACSKKSGGGAKLRTDVDSVAYIVGLNVGTNLLRMDSTLNVAAVCDGIRDAFRRSQRMSDDEARSYFLRYMNHTLPEKSRAYEEQLLEEIVRSNRSYARTSSGVAYTVDEVGDQEQIPSSDRDSVRVRWVIRSAEGDELYSSYERGDTLCMALGETTVGVRESLKLIGKGGRIHAWIPSKAAYGATGNAELGIRPNAVVYYEIELIAVDKFANRNRRRN